MEHNSHLLDLPASRDTEWRSKEEFPCGYKSACSSSAHWEAPIATHAKKARISTLICCSKIDTLFYWSQNLHVLQYHDSNFPLFHNPRHSQALLACSGAFTLDSAFHPCPSRGYGDTRGTIALQSEFSLVKKNGFSDCWGMVMSEKAIALQILLGGFILDSAFQCIWGIWILRSMHACLKWKISVEMSTWTWPGTVTLQSLFPSPGKFYAKEHERWQETVALQIESGQKLWIPRREKLPLNNENNTAMWISALRGIMPSLDAYIDDIVKIPVFNKKVRAVVVFPRTLLDQGTAAFSHFHEQMPNKQVQCLSLTWSSTSTNPTGDIYLRIQQPPVHLRLTKDTGMDESPILSKLQNFSQLLELFQACSASGSKEKLRMHQEYFKGTVDIHKERGLFRSPEFVPVHRPKKSEDLDRKLKRDQKTWFHAMKHQSLEELYVSNTSRRPLGPKQCSRSQENDGRSINQSTQSTNWLGMFFYEAKHFNPI